MDYDATSDIAFAQAVSSPSYSAVLHPVPWLGSSCGGPVRTLDLDVTSDIAFAQPVSTVLTVQLCVTTLTPGSAQAVEASFRRRRHERDVPNRWFERLSLWPMKRQPVWSISAFTTEVPRGSAVLGGARRRKGG